MISSEFLDLLRCPVSRAELRVEGESLVTRGVPAKLRYPVKDGVPILLSAPSLSAPRRPQQDERAISESFRSRSRGYFEDNYGPGGNPERLARRHALLAILRERVRPSMKVLDAGAGPTVFAEDVRSLTGRYVALDLSLENLLRGRERVGPLDSVVGSVGALPIRENAFDAVLAIGCLEYVVDIESAICELCRVAKPGGFVIATFANSRSPRRWWDELIVHPLSRVKLAASGRSGTAYRRWLISTPKARRLFSDAGAHVERVQYLNPGLLGYPLSASVRLRTAQDSLTRSLPSLRRLASEVLVVARKSP